MCNNESFMNTNGNNWQILHERIRDASQPNVTLWRKLFKNENLDVIRPLTLAYMYKKKLNATHRCWFLHVVLQKYHIS